MAEKTVRIRYEGPCDKVNVAPYGEHAKGQVKEYPEDFAKELIKTSEFQKFTWFVKGKTEKKKEKDEKSDSQIPSQTDDGKVEVIMLQDSGILKIGQTARYKTKTAKKLVDEGKAKYLN